MAEKQYPSAGALRKEIERRTTKLTDEAWAIIRPGWYAPYGTADVAEVLQHLRELTPTLGVDRLQNTLRKAERQARAESERRSLTQRRFVEDLRVALFAAPTPPFSSLQGAQAWIDATALSEGAPTAEKVLEDQRTGEQTILWRGPGSSGHEITEQEALALQPGQTLHQRLARPLLAMVGLGGGTRRTAVVAGGALDRLQEASFELAKRLDCWPSVATLHILTGTVALVAPVTHTTEVSATKDTGVSVRHGVQANYPWVPEALIAAAFTQAKRSIPIASSPRRRPAPNRAELITFVESLPDNLPWEERRITWNHTHPDRPFTSARNFKEAYAKATK